MFALPLLAHTVFAWYLFVWGELIRRWDLGSINDYFVHAAFAFTFFLAVFMLNRKTRVVVSVVAPILFLAEVAVLVGLLWFDDPYGYAKSLYSPLLALGVCGVLSAIFGRLFSGFNEIGNSSYRWDFPVFSVLATHAVACSLYSLVFLKLFLETGSSWTTLASDLEYFRILPIGAIICGIFSIFYFSNLFFTVIGWCALLGIVALETLWAFGSHLPSLVALFPALTKLELQTSGFLNFFFIALWSCSVAALLLASVRLITKHYAASLIEV